MQIIFQALQRPVRKSPVLLSVSYTHLDAMPANPNLIENLVKALRQEKVGAAYARQLPAKDCRVIERYTRSFNYPKESFVKSWDDLTKMGIKTYFCSNVCAAYRKDIYDSLGGFEEQMCIRDRFYTDH